MVAEAPHLLGDLDARKMDRQLDILLEVFKQTAETERTALSAEAKKGSELSEQELRMAELSAELGDGIMGHLAKLMIERNRSNVMAKKASAE